MGWAQLDVVLPADDGGLGGAGLRGGRPARVMPPASANRDCGRHAHHELLSPCEHDATLPKQPSRFRPYPGAPDPARHVGRDKGAVRTAPTLTQRRCRRWGDCPTQALKGNRRSTPIALRSPP